MTPLEKAQAKVREMRSAGISPERLSLTEKAQRNPRSLRAAINAKCWECSGAGADPGTKRRIGECRIKRCPLHPVRPYQKAAE